MGAGACEGEGFHHGEIVRYLMTVSTSETHYVGCLYVVTGPRLTGDPVRGVPTPATQHHHLLPEDGPAGLPGLYLDANTGRPYIDNKVSR